MTTVRAVGGPIATPGMASAGMASASTAAGRRRDLARRCRCGRRGPRTRSAGVAIGLVSAMCFGTSGTFGSALIGSGWSPAGAVFARVLVAALALTVPAVLALRGRWRALLPVRLAGDGLRAGRGGGVPGLLLQRDRADAGRDLDHARVSGDRAHRGLAVGAARPAAATADHRRRGGRARRARADAQPDRQRRREPLGVLWALAAAVSMAVYFFQSAATSETGGDAERRGVGQRRCGPGAAADLPPVVLTWGGMIVGAAAIALLGAARVTPLRFAGVGRRAVRRAHQLDRAGARARRAGGGDRVRDRHRGGAPAGRSSGRSSRWPRSASRCCSPGSCCTRRRRPCSSSAAR